MTNSPPRRSATLLTEWVEEFRAQGHLIAGDVHVAPQEDDDTADTGLVIVNLHHANAAIIIQATGYDQPLWEATLTARDDDLTLAPHALASLAAELVVAGNLCTFLQFKALEWDRYSGRPGDRPGAEPSRA